MYINTYSYMYSANTIWCSTQSYSAHTCQFLLFSTSHVQCTGTQYQRQEQPHYQASEVSKCKNGKLNVQIEKLQTTRREYEETRKVGSVKTNMKCACCTVQQPQMHASQTSRSWSSSPAISSSSLCFSLLVMAKTPPASPETWVDQQCCHNTHTHTHTPTHTQGKIMRTHVKRVEFFLPILFNI